MYIFCIFVTFYYKYGIKLLDDVYFHNLLGVIYVVIQGEELFRVFTDYTTGCTNEIAKGNIEVDFYQRNTY